VLVVDRLVPFAAAELRRVVVAEHSHRRRIGEDEEPVVIDDPDRQGDVIQDRLQRSVRLTRSVVACGRA
jgi:hypothetical protein